MIPKGPAGRFVSLGGQGISISSYSKKQDAAKKFLAWFEKEDTQKEWVKLGGLTANSKVAATDLYRTAMPWNTVFAASTPYLKDFYNTPNYSELLTASQKDLNAAVAGVMSPKDALDDLAQVEQKSIDESDK
jgi:multiple sugar transport system substrate-binding protein